MAKENWKSLTSIEISEWRKLISDFPAEPYYKQIGQDELPATIPESLRAKIDSAVVMASGTTAGMSIMVCNLCRVDFKDQAVDQQPFAVIFDSNGSSQSGMFLDHGGWDGRTEAPPPEFWNHVNQSGIGNYFYPKIESGCASGYLSDLTTTSHRDAFDAVVRRFRNKSLLDNPADNHFE